VATVLPGMKGGKPCLFFPQRYLSFGVALGGLVRLVIFSLLAMAAKGDKYLDQLEFE